MNIDQYRSFHQILEEQAERYGGKNYIESVNTGRSISFSEMNRYCNQVSNYLKDHNIRREDRITLIGKNTIETLIIFYGVLRYGAIINPLNSEESLQNILQMIKRVHPAVVIHDQDIDFGEAKDSSLFIPFKSLETQADHGNDFFPLIRDYSSEFDNPVGEKQDIAEILFTSGSTAMPKGVVISRESLFYMADEVVEKMDVSPEDRILEYRSYSWESAQLLSVLSSMLAGATLILAERFSRSNFASWLKKYKVTKSSGIPTVLNILVSHPIELHKKDVPHLQMITSSSAPLSKETFLRFEEMYGIAINQMAGMTEAGWMFGNRPEKRKFGSVGTPFKYKSISIVRSDGKKCSVGEEGEIVVKGKSVGSGYLDEQGNIVKFPKRGFHTGDMGYIDSDGYIFMTGRKKDIIIRGGVNISPLEISDRIMKHPAVSQVVTMGVPDSKYGEEVACFIVSKPGESIDETTVVTFCKQTLPDFKVPKQIFFVDMIPKNERGKVSKEDLLKMINDLPKQATSIRSGYIEGSTKS